jgi:hypothetical protein
MDYSSFTNDLIKDGRPFRSLFRMTTERGNLLRLERELHQKA